MKKGVISEVILKINLKNKKRSEIYSNHKNKFKKI